MVAFPALWSVPTLVPVPFVSTLAMTATPWAVFALFPINGSIDITKGQAEEMGITSLIRDYILVNSGLPWDPGTSKFSEQSDGKTDEKVSSKLVSYQEDLDEDDFQQRCGLRSYPDEVSQHSSYKIVAEGMELVQCAPSRTSCLLNCLGGDTSVVWLKYFISPYLLLQQEVWLA